jgi:hypothetical protein
VAAVQDVEDTVGQHDRLGQPGDARCELGTRGKFLFEIGHGNKKSRRHIACGF